MKHNIGLGTAAIGRPLYINLKAEKSISECNLETFIAEGQTVLEEAYQNGVRFFDTAPGYGIAEQIVQDWVQEKKNPEIIISTKWGYTYVADFKPDAKVHEVKEHSLNKLNEQWETSKHLLPNLKYYQIHSATFESGVLENEAVLNRLFQIKKEHQIKIGLTTSGENQTEVLQSALSISIDNEFLFDSFQSTFNILDQSIHQLNKELNGRFLIIKEALANGRLIPNETYSHYKDLFDVITILAQKYKVGVDAIVLRFCLDIFPNAMVLSGANNATHLQANLRAKEFRLTEKELYLLKGFGIKADQYWEERKQLKWN